MDREEGAGVRQGSARALGHVGLSMDTGAVLHIDSLQKPRRGVTVSFLDFSASEPLLSISIRYEGI